MNESFKRPDYSNIKTLIRQENRYKNSNVTTNKKNAPKGRSSCFPDNGARDGI